MKVVLFINIKFINIHLGIVSRGRVFIKKMSDHGIKWFQPSKFFACGRAHIIHVLIKEMSAPGIKRFLPSKVFAAAGSYYTCFNKGNISSRIKIFPPSKFFACGRAHIIDVLIKEERKCQILG